MTKLSVTTSIRGQIDLIAEISESFPDKGRILDIGTGSGLAARKFLEAGWKVSATGFDMDAYLDAAPLPEGIEVLQDVDICNAHQFADESFDAIWCAHVLEHVSNTGQALEEIHRLLKPDGWLLIAVPPYKEQVVGGHVNSGWNLGSLMYVLADAGFDLADGRFIQHGYNVFGMVRRGTGKLPQGVLHRTNGDIEALAKAGRFPNGFNPKQGFSGRLHAVNWKWNCPPTEIPAPRRELASPPPIPPMWIGFFAPGITTGKDAGENSGQTIANAMAVRGHEVIIFTFDNTRAPSRWPLHDRITLVHLPEADDEPADHRMAVEIAARNLDVLVGLHMNRATLRYVRCAHKAGLPLVLSEQMDPRCPKWMGTFSLEERDIAMSGATLIHLTINAYMKTLDPSERGKVRVIPNTVPEPAKLAKPGTNKPRHTLLAIADLVPHKNIMRIIDAFGLLAREFPDWHLQIVGDGPLRSQLEGQVRDLGLGDRVDFASNHNNVYAFHAAADLFVIPSLFDEFPLSLYEAMAHGLPAVGFGLCAGVRAQIRDGETGLLCADGEAKTLAATLRQLMQDDAARARMGAAARKSFIRQFGNDVIYAAWEELLAEAKETYSPLKRPNHATLMAGRVWEHVWGPVTGADAIERERI